MDNLEEKLTQEFQRQLLKAVSDMPFIRLEYNERQRLPSDFIEKLWAQVDWDNVLAVVKPEIEKRICNTIIGSMQTEVGTDVKKLMQVDGVRQKLRMEVYPKLMSVLEGNP